MKIAIIGSGGREHALVHHLSNSKKITKIYSIPGNAGTEEISVNIDLNLENFQDLYDFIYKEQIELVIVGPEKPLVEGLVDFLESKNIKVFGPRKKVAQLEGSKIFTKQICRKYNIPTANFAIFENKNDANNFLKTVSFPIVIKADNLASGKGVYICKNLNESFVAVEEIFNGKFGKAENLLIEEFLSGEEMSFFTLHDGKTFQTFGTAQDHKRVLEGDKGKNTGGMGAYSPSRLISKELENKIINKIIKPTLKGLSDLGTEYLGFLYTGLMIIKNEPYLIEYNVRMGDPECQTILPRLKTDLYYIFHACCNKKLNEISIEWLNKKSLCVVVCSKGYPEKFEKNIEINSLDKIKLNKYEYIYHAGTKLQNEKMYAIGGRVLNFVSLSDTFADARKKIHRNILNLSWHGGFYRKDIGYKVID